MKLRSLLLAITTVTALGISGTASANHDRHESFRGHNHYHGNYNHGQRWHSSRYDRGHHRGHDKRHYRCDHRHYRRHYHDDLWLGLNFRLR